MGTMAQTQAQSGLMGCSDPVEVAENSEFFCVGIPLYMVIICRLHVPVKRGYVLRKGVGNVMGNLFVATGPP